MSPKKSDLRSILVIALIAGAPAHAADVTVQPAAGSGFVVKDAAGANERLRVQESGAVTLPGVPGAAAQTTGLCMSGTGLLGPCSSGSGSGQAYTAATGLSLTGTTFSVAPTYQLPQGCSSTQIPQWSGSAWACASASGAALPAGTVNQTLHYNSGNALVANNMLLAFADGGLLATGTFGIGAIPETGAGARMMWYPGKQAFRAGYVGGTQWDDTNVGASSIALGKDTKASGVNSTALGATTTASGNASTAMGAATTATGGEAVAMGDTTTASGTDSTAMGFTTNASGDFSTAIGNTTTASGKNSIAMGEKTTASGYASTAMSEGSIASGDYSVAMGFGANTNNHSGSFAFSDSTGAANDTDHQFLVQASGGIKFLNQLEVDGFITYNNGSYAYFIDYNNSPAQGQCGCDHDTVSIYAPNGAVMATGFDALSDARIKDIVGPSDPVRDLAILNAIEVTDYTMRDKARFGNQPFKKVIAQQVEQVYPQLVAKHTDFIPDVYKLASKVESVGGGYKLAFDAPHGLTPTAKKLKLLPEGKSAFEQVDVLAIPSDREVVVRASGWTAERVFVYGEEVEDLRTVDYDGLTALNVSATQELSKHIDAQQTRQAQLTAQLTDKDAQIEALRLDLAAQKVRVAALESAAGDLAALNREFAAMQAQLQTLQSSGESRTTHAVYPRRRHADVLVTMMQP